MILSLVVLLGMSSFAFSAAALNPDPECPAGTGLMADFNFENGDYDFEKPGGPGNNSDISRTQFRVSQEQTKSVRPILDCVVQNWDDTYMARFGYLNKNSSAIEIPIGPKNKFFPFPKDEGQPSTLLPGRHGSIDKSEAFSVPFNGGPLTWVLMGPDGIIRFATASSKSSRCPCPASAFNEELDFDSRTVILTIADDNGIATVSFAGPDGEPYPNNYFAHSDHLLPADSNGFHWVSAGGNLPTEVVFALTAGDDWNSNYSADIQNGCSTRTIIDPINDFASGAGPPSFFPDVK